MKASRIHSTCSTIRADSTRRRNKGTPVDPGGAQIPLPRSPKYAASRAPASTGVPSPQSAWRRACSCSDRIRRTRTSNKPTTFPGGRNHNSRPAGARHRFPVLRDSPSSTFQWFDSMRSARVLTRARWEPEQVDSLIRKWAKLGTKCMIWRFGKAQSQGVDPMQTYWARRNVRCRRIDHVQSGTFFSKERHLRKKKNFKRTAFRGLKRGTVGLIKQGRHGRRLVSWGT